VGIWDAVSYLAFIAIIIGVFSERYRNVLITLGAAVLAMYAWFFLENLLFTILQLLIVVSGVMQLVRLSGRIAVTSMVILTSVAYMHLYISGAITDVWALIGSFGLLGIALGLVILPKHYGFLFMAAGGMLLILYAFDVEAWVFFFLNIFFVVANLRTWLATIPPSKI